MATQKQRIAVEKIVENRGNVSKSMREAGYEDITAKNPKNLTESKGFAEICNELGLTDELILQALVEDIIGKRKNRVQELSLAAKIKGLITNKQDITSNGESINPYSVLTAEELRKLAR